MLARLPWPLPALLVWGSAWALFFGLHWMGPSALASLLVASSFCVAFSLLTRTWWRRVMMGLGFPLSLALSGMVNLPAWAWLLPLLLLLLLYPITAWRDAPLFPTPAHALRHLPGQARLPAGARVLDAGCGLGAGLRALRQAYPQAQLCGLEWSWLLRVWCALRCPWAEVRQGDMWRASWHSYQLVYLFQRPESMARAVAKARAELAPGSWLVSLEFEATELQAQATLRCADGRPVWLYRTPFQPRHEAVSPDYRRSPR